VEPADILSAIEPSGARPAFDPMNLMARGLRARFRRAGLKVADQVFGLAWSGAMTTARLSGLIARCAEGLTEIYLHPATAGGYAGCAPGYLYAEELAALIAPEVAEALTRSKIKTGGFADFTT